MRHREASLERCSLNSRDSIGEDSTKTVGRRNGPSASTDPVFSVDFLKPTPMRAPRVSVVAWALVFKNGPFRLVYKQRLPSSQEISHRREQIEQQAD